MRVESAIKLCMISVLVELVNDGGGEENEF